MALSAHDLETNIKGHACWFSDTVSKLQGLVNWTLIYLNTILEMGPVKSPKRWLVYED